METNRNGGEAFPVRDYENFPQRVLGGVTLSRSRSRWVALVVVQTPYGRRLKFYVWVRRGDGWKVDLANVDVTRWDWARIADTARRLQAEWGLLGSGSSD